MVILRTLYKQVVQCSPIRTERMYPDAVKTRAYKELHFKRANNHPGPLAHLQLASTTQCSYDGSRIITSSTLDLSTIPPISLVLCVDLLSQ